MFKLARFPRRRARNDAEAGRTVLLPAKVLVMDDDDEGRRESGSTMERQLEPEQSAKICKRETAPPPVFFSSFFVCLFVLFLLKQFGV